MSNIAILGAGSFGVSLATLLVNNGNSVVCYCRNNEQLNELKSSHKHKAFKDIVLNENIEFTNNLFECVYDKNIVIFAVPSVAIKDLSKKLYSEFLNNNYKYEDVIFLNVSKGIYGDNFEFLSDIISKELHTENIAILSGPSHAEEIIKNMPTSVICASNNKNISTYICDVLINDFFRVYISEDINGIELVAALKNVYALGAGICDGLGYGDNLRAALITRGIAEITRLGIAMKCSVDSFYGLAGIGDLIVTCQSMHSRNKRAGILIGKGLNYKDAVEEIGMTVEGIYCADIAYEMAKKYKVEMPILNEVYKVVFENKSPIEATKDLMNRPIKESKMY